MPRLLVSGGAPQSHSGRVLTLTRVSSAEEGDDKNARQRGKSQVNSMHTTSGLII